MGESGFILRFLQGRMWYWMAPMEFDQTLAAYQEWDRTIWMQELNLTPTQRLALRNFLNWNAQPQNARYRYDYYLDNCSNLRSMGGPPMPCCPWAKPALVFHRTHWQ
jgi:hypothetical protein